MKRIFSLILVLVIAFSLYIPISANWNIPNKPDFDDTISNSDLVSLWSDSIYSYVISGSSVGGSFSPFYGTGLKKDEYDELVGVIGNKSPIFNQDILYSGTDEYGDYFYGIMNFTVSLPAVSNCSSFLLSFMVSTSQALNLTSSVYYDQPYLENLTVRIYNDGDILGNLSSQFYNGVWDYDFSSSFVDYDPVSGKGVELGFYSPFSSEMVDGKIVKSVGTHYSSVVLFLLASDYGLSSFSDLNLDFSFSLKFYEDSIEPNSGLYDLGFYPLLVPYTSYYNPSISDSLQIIEELEKISGQLSDINDNITGFRQDIMNPSSSQVSQASAQNSVLSSASDLISSIGSEIDITLSPEQSNDISSQFAFVQGVGDEVSSAIADPGSPLALISACFNSGSKTFSGFGFIIWAILLCMTLALISIILYGFKAKGG